MGMLHMYKNIRYIRIWLTAPLVLIWAKPHFDKDNHRIRIQFPVPTVYVFLYRDFTVWDLGKLVVRRHTRGIPIKHE